jgi:hypothetical protein
LTDLRSGRQTIVHSIHSSALYAPYPFANSIAENFARIEDFQFTDSRGNRYRCEVSTVFAPQGDGFAILTAQSSGQNWMLSVMFHDAQGPKHTTPYQLNLI